MKSSDSELHCLLSIVYKEFRQIHYAELVASLLFRTRLAPVNAASQRHLETARWKLNVVSVIFWLSAIFVCSAETPPTFRSRLWQTEDGLPRNSVAAICQTLDGFLWIGTDGGLARFDGVEFDPWPLDPAQEKFPSITALCGDERGGLWVGTGNQGLFYFNEGKWARQSGAGFFGVYVTSLHQGHDGVIWIGTRSGLWRHQAGELLKFNESPELGTNFIRSLFEDAQQRMWVSYSIGLACIAHGRVQTNYPAQGTFPDPLVRTAMVDRRGSLWVGTRNGLNRRGVRVTTFFKKDGLPDNIVSALHEDKRGILWVGTYGGLTWREGGKFITETRDGDAMDQVFCFHEDHEGNVWAGTKEGLFRFTPQNCQTFTRRQGLAHNNVITVLPAEGGDVWAGTWGGGLNYLAGDKVAGHFNRARLPEMQNDLVLALCQGNNGSVWFGTDFGGGVYELQHLDNDWRCLRYEPVAGPPLRAVRAITRDARDNVWIGTTDGLYRRDGKLLVPCSVTSDTNLSVRCLLQGRDGKFWIGTESGLVCWSENRTNVFTTAHGLSDNRILALHEDAEGTLWIGTAQGGLNRFEVSSFKFDGSETSNLQRQTFDFRHYSTADGLHNNTVLEILETKEGFLWMSSYHGIFCVAKRDLKNYQPGKSSPLRCLTFGKEDGMESPVCVGAAKPSGCQAADGRLWFPTTKGLVVVNPSIPLNENPPPVAIKEVIADKTVQGLKLKVQSREQGSARATLNFEPETLNLKPGRGELEIHFSALSFQAPAKNRYKYKLENVDADWVGPTTQRIASYNNLKPGRYTFHVMAANNHGVWNTQGAAITLNWQPHFWQTWTFKILVGGLVLLILLGLDRLRVARLRAVERLRLRIAADLHDEVGSNLGSLSMLARVLRKSTTMTVDEQKDVALIERVTAETANAVKDIVWFTNPACDTMQDMLMRMKDTAETMLTGIECSFETDIEDITTKMPLEFRKNVFLIFKETLANIVKHSQATRVAITVSEHKGLWCLRIRDNGAGFDPVARSRGNGLKNFRRRAAEIGADIDVQSKPGCGAMVEIRARLR